MRGSVWCLRIEKWCSGKDIKLKVGSFIEERKIGLEVVVRSEEVSYRFLREKLVIFERVFRGSFVFRSVSFCWSKRDGRMFKKKRIFFEGLFFYLSVKILF